MTRVSGEALLEVRGLSVALPHAGTLREVLQEVDLDVAPAECVAVVGESGAGKTQLARALVGLLPRGGTRRGRIAFRGVALPLAEPRAWSGIAGAGIGLVFQDSHAALAPHRTLGGQLEDVLLAHGAPSRARARLQAQHWFERVAIDQAARRLDQYPSELSGGLRQRAAIALALAARPALLIADEPTSALDPTLAMELLGLLKRLKEEQEVGLLLISHDLAVVAGLADRVMTLYAGRVVEEAPVDSLYATPRHPYTARLLGRLTASGSLADDATVSAGCAYRAHRQAGARLRCHHPLADPA